MTAWEWLRVIGILGPIAFMVVVGLYLSVRSGVSSLATTQGARRTVYNASQTVMLLSGCLLSLAVLHHLVGQHLPRMW